MYIKSMSLVRGTDNAIIRHVDFHLGTNFVIDAEDSSKHNKVGKTTFLKLIDIAMGPLTERIFTSIPRRIAIRRN